jgi:HEAT repeat protein
LIIGGGQALLPEVARMKEVEEKTKAVQALGELADPTAVDPIIRYGLKADDPGIRAESAVALGKTKDRRAVVPLTEAVKPYYDSAPVDVEGVIQDMGSVPDTARQMKEREARVRASVAWALGQIADPRAHEILVRAANDDNSLVRDAAAEALARITEREEREKEKSEHSSTAAARSP